MDDTDTIKKSRVSSWLNVLGGAFWWGFLLQVFRASPGIYIPLHKSKYS